MALAAGLVVGAVMAPLAREGAVRAPGRVAIYYGIPSLVNGAGGDVERAARTFARYDLVVFGDGLQYDRPRLTPPTAGPVEYRRTVEIVERVRALNPATAMFGYLPLGARSRAIAGDVDDNLRRWRTVGVRGVLLDEAGYDFGVTRDWQNRVIDAAHRTGLRVLMNAFDPEDAASPRVVPLNSTGGGNPRGIATVLTSGDLLLLESLAVRNGTTEDPSLLAQRAASAERLRREYGLRVLAVATAGRRFDQPLCDLGWWSAVLWGFDGFAWGEENYSASDSTLPDRRCGGTLPSNLAAAGAAQRDGTRFRRAVSGGWIALDLTARRAGYVPDDQAAAADGAAAVVPSASAR